MPHPQKKHIQKEGGGGKFWCLSLIVPGFFWWGKASISKLYWKNDGNGFLDLMNISDGVHKLQSSKVFLIYYKPYVSDILLINVNLYDRIILLEGAALLVTALWKKKMLPWTRKLIWVWIKSWA